MHSTVNYSHAEKLRQELEQPQFNPLLKKWVGRGELDYERYLGTATLLSLQSSEQERVAHDELMFQIVHQSQELWLKLASREVVEVVAELDRDSLWAVAGRLDRVARILRNITAEMAVLETMTPDTYQTIRRSLGNGSGQESPGYNTLRLTASGLEESLERLLARRQRTLVSVYLGGGADDLKHVCERLVDVDEAFQGWLYAHFQLVRRTIGVDRAVKALDGLPTQVLAGRMNLPLFRKLWDVRVEMTSAWKREGGYTPGTQRAEGGGCPAHAALREEAALAAAAAAGGCPAHAGGARAQASETEADAGFAVHTVATHRAPEATMRAAGGGGCPAHAPMYAAPGPRGQS